MRIHRISLRDFRGVEQLDVEFDAAGVTIVEGPNEAGKTSLADAFTLLLDHKDSSSKKVIREVQPVGRDVGPFAEAEFTVGHYRLVYRKQWCRERKTELEISGPQHEQLTGEAAHNRVIELLETETDPVLFRALRYEQGVTITQAEVGKASSLLKALDVAAGGTTAPDGAQHDALLDRVDAERLRYFTPAGAILGARKDKAARLDELSKEVGEYERRIRELETAAERQRQIEAKLADLSAQAPKVAKTIEESRDAVARVERVEHGVELARHAHEKAEVILRDAMGAWSAREKLIESAETTARTVADLEEESTTTAPQLDAARTAVESTKKGLAEASASLELAEQDAAGHRGLVELFEERLQRDLLQERHDALIAADAVIEAAEQLLDGCAVDEALLGEIDRAEHELAVASGRAKAGKPSVKLEALRPIQVTLDGQTQDVMPGGPIEAVVSAPLEATIADIARIVITPPDFTNDAEDALIQAQRRLDELLARGGVTSRSEAHAVARERDTRQTECAHAQQGRQVALRDLEPAQLAGKLGRAKQRVATLEGKLDLAVTSDLSLDEARALAEEADAKVQAARSIERERRTAVEGAESALQVLEQKGIEDRLRLETARTEADRAASELERGRAEAPDDELRRARSLAESRLQVAANELEVVERELAAGDPESTRAMLANAEELQSRLEQDVSTCEVERAETRTMLQLAGHQGLADRLAEKRAIIEELRREVDSENRHAAAAERLHAVLSEKREQAQQAYIGPFRDKVNAYARILYGPHVEVVVDHRSFAISSRTLNGATVPFDSLSGGVREQLAVLSRLACGALVCPATSNGTPGGVPVLIDDALGYSDPERLERLGAAIHVAGQDCQVIVFTCEPGRYRGVGGATVISLS